MQPLTFFHRLSNHFDLMKRMMARTGVEDTLNHLPGAPEVIRRAAIRCAGCRQAEACAEWLDDFDNAVPAPARPVEAPSYCRNHDLIERLKAMT